MSDEIELDKKIRRAVRQSMQGYVRRLEEMHEEFGDAGEKLEELSKAIERLDDRISTLVEAKRKNQRCRQCAGMGYEDFGSLGRAPCAHCRGTGREIVAERADDA